MVTGTEIALLSVLSFHTYTLLVHKYFSLSVNPPCPVGFQSGGAGGRVSRGGARAEPVAGRARQARTTAPPATNSLSLNNIASEFVRCALAF